MVETGRKLASGLGHRRQRRDGERGDRVSILEATSRCSVHEFQSSWNEKCSLECMIVLSVVWRRIRKEEDGYLDRVALVVDDRIE